mgnify:CR=1 FL=1
MNLVGVDVGGTFTDVMYSDTVGRRMMIHKVPTTGDDPSRGVMTGILELCERNGIDAADIDYVFHGTTIATNAILEYRGAEAGMITTRGFRDIIHIGRHKRPFNFSIQQDLPWQKHSLVPRRHRLTVSERISAPNGAVLKPLDEAAVRAAALKLKEEGVEAVDGDVKPARATGSVGGDADDVDGGGRTAGVQLADGNPLGRVEAAVAVLGIDLAVGGGGCVVLGHSTGSPAFVV